MRHLRTAAIVAVTALVAGVVMMVTGAFGASSTLSMNAGDTTHVTCGGPSLGVANQTATALDLNCAENPTTTTLPGSTTTQPCTPAVLLGSTTVQATSDSSSGSASEAFGYTATASGTAASVSIYLTSTDGAQVALYADSSAHPGALLDTAKVASNTAGWTSIALPGGVTVASGTRYWIAVGSTGGTANVTYRDHDSTGTNLDFSGTGFASPYASNAQWMSNPVSAYVSSACSGTTTTTAPATTTTAPQTTTTGPPPPPGLLPGEQLWGPNRVSSLLFGTNDSVNYGSPNVENQPAVQANIRDAHLTLLREVFQDGASDSEVQTRVQTIRTLGMTGLCLFEKVDNLNFMEHVLSLAGSACPLVEFGNELDYNGYTATSYLAAWNGDIPTLRAMFPGVDFGGPTSVGIGTGLMQGFIQGTAQSGVMPDFLSFHEYPCYGSTSTTDCLTNGPGLFAYDYQTTIGWENQYWGHTVPTGISEWNFDPGGSNLYNWSGDGTFMYQFTEAALQTFISDGFAFANQYTSLNYSGYGALDMFNDSSPYAPKCQFWGMADMGEKNGSGSALSIPTC